jgi:hypothetical protein
MKTHERIGIWTDGSLREPNGPLENGIRYMSTANNSIIQTKQMKPIPETNLRLSLKLVIYCALKSLLDSKLTLCTDSANAITNIKKV